MTRSCSGSAHQPDVEELTAALETVLRSHFGEPVLLRQLRLRPSPYRTSFDLYEIDATCDSGMTMSLMLKDVGWHALHESAVGVKPHFLYDPLREIEAYTAVLTHRDLGTPTVYGAVVAPEKERYWIFMERVPGLALFEAEVDVWLQVARWLAGLHSRFMSGADLMALGDLSHLVRYDQTYFRRWPERAQNVLAMSTRDPARQARLDRLAGNYDQVVDRLVLLPATFVHGEFFASNVLVQRVSGGLRVAPVDWEMAGVGPGVIDLAALVAGSWTAGQVTEIARTYYGTLTTMGSVRMAWAEFLEHLACCRIHVAMQLAGWSAGWSPPSEHARDWLNEALEIAVDLGVC